MKSLPLVALLAAGPLFAGEDAASYEKTPIPGKNPISAKGCIAEPEATISWFAGGSVGYLTQNEEEFYNLQVGVDLPNQLWGFDQAIYLEVGYAELKDTQTFRGGRRVRWWDIEIVPVTINYKLEKQLSGDLNWYMGLGVGAAFIDASRDSNNDNTGSGDDTVFFGQAFTGLLYNVNPAWEIFGGVRYIYFDEPTFDGAGAGDSDVSWGQLDDQGYSFDNEDLSVDLGARYNF